MKNNKRNIKLNNIIKKIFVSIMIFLMSVSMFTGCQLAVEESTETQANLSEIEEVMAGDILCGVFLSMEDLFWKEKSYLTDEDFQKALEGEAVDFYEKKVEGDRIYATLKKEVDENGYEHEEYVFEGCEGIGLFTYYEVKEGQMPCSTLGSGTEDSAADIHVYYNKTDNGSENKVEATIYINKEKIKEYEDEFGDSILNVYSVFQTNTGELYLKEETFVVVSDGFGLKLEDTVTSDISGTEEQYTGIVDLTFEVVKPADKTYVYEMNESNQVINTIAIDNGDIPNKIKVNQDTEYVVVEEYMGEELIDRDMVNMNAKYEEDHGVFIDIPEKNTHSAFLEKIEVELKKKK